MADPDQPTELLTSSSGEPATVQPSRSPLRHPATIAAALLLVLVVAVAVVIAGRLGGDHQDAGPARLAYTAAATAAITVAGGANGVTVDPGSRRLYVAGTSPSTGLGTLSVIDADTEKITRTIEVGKYPGDIAVGQGGRTVYVAIRDGISVVDLDAGAVTGTIKFEQRPSGLAVLGRDLYVAHPSSVDITELGPGDKLDTAFPNLSIIDTATNKVITTLSTGGPDALALAADPLRSALYAVNLTNDITAVDARMRTVTKRFRIDPAKLVGIMGLAVDRNRLYAAGVDAAGGQGALTDITGGMPAAPITMPGPLGQIAIDSDARRAYVLIPAVTPLPDSTGGQAAEEARDGGLAVVDLDAKTVTDIVEVGADPRSVAVDPTTHTAYVANADDTVSVIKPGSIKPASIKPAP